RDGGVPGDGLDRDHRSEFGRFSGDRRRNCRTGDNWRDEVLLHATVRSTLGEDVALVDPDLHTDSAEGGVCFCEAVVDVGAEGVAWNATLRVGLAAGHFGAAEAAGDS